MNGALVLHLVRKDWYLTRTILATIAVAGAISIGILYLKTETSGFLGLSCSLIVLIFLSILLPMQTVVNERKKQNLPFVMSLPISPMEYTTAKIVGNLSAFFVLWLAIVAGVLGTIARAGVFGGFIPFGVIAGLAPFVAFCLLLAMSLIVESEAGSVVTMSICNVSYSFAWYFLIRLPSVQHDLKSPVAVWRQPITGVLVVEIALIVIALGLTFFFQSRKRHFI